MALAGEDVGPWHSVLAGEVFGDFLGLVKPSFSAPAPVQGDGGDQSLGEVGLEAWIFQGVTCELCKFSCEVNLAAVFEVVDQLA